MDDAKKLAHLLEGCGAKYTRTDATEGTLFTVSTGDGQYFVLVRDDGAGIEMWSRYFTPEQAIVATVGSGTCSDTGECMWFCCSECGFGIGDIFINNETKYGVYDDTFPRYCPWCGSKVARA